jgi:8-oxo-dGTP pyrophosphatase MutT (NUDIX family)
MSPTLDLATLPSKAHNHPNDDVVYEDESFTVKKVTSTNDAKNTRTKLVLSPKSHGRFPVDVVAILARFWIGKRVYVVLTRQWREATSAYSIAFPAGRYGPADADPVATGLRELAEETPFTADREDVFFEGIPSFSSDGCLQETNQILGVYATVKPNTQLKDGIARGATDQTEGENIWTLYCSEQQLYETLLEWKKCGHSIDSRLMNYAIGVHLAAAPNNSETV